VSVFVPSRQTSQLNLSNLVSSYRTPYNILCAFFAVSSYRLRFRVDRTERADLITLDVELSELRRSLRDLGVSFAVS
jgi:hypothetical protein